MEPTLPDLLQQASRAFDHGRGDLAEGILRRVLERHPTHSYAVPALSAAFRLQRRWEEALVQARRGVALVPDSSYAHHTLGMIFDYMEDYAAAIRHSREAIRLEPLNVRRYYLLANAYHNAECFPEAIEVAEQGLQLRADDGPLQRQRAVSLAGAGRVDEAEAALAEVFRMMPDHASTFFTAGWTYWTLKRYERAIAEFRRALQKNPMSADSHALMGLSLYELRRYREARPELQEAIRLNPYNKNCRATLTAIDGLAGASMTGPPAES